MIKGCKINSFALQEYSDTIIIYPNTKIATWCFELLQSFDFFKRITFYNIRQYYSHFLPNREIVTRLNLFLKFSGDLNFHCSATC